MILLNEGSLFAHHYQLEKKLGTGSFGEVWLAKNLLADLDVAIKIYNWVDESGFKDFREEFKIAYKLNHPNLLHINHFDVYDQRPFLVMPYCKNGSAINLIGKMSEKQIWLFIRDVSCGLMYLHSQKPLIIHQDIKPGNILIGDNGRFMISDFGISKKIENTLHKNIGDKTSSGTLAYMGPEHFSENPHIVATSDIWSLGMSIIELLTGKVLWEGLGGCIQQNGAHIPTLSDKCSYELEELIHKCLSLQTWDRPSAKYIYDYSCNILSEQKLPNNLSSNPIKILNKKESHSATDLSTEQKSSMFLKKHKIHILCTLATSIICCFLIIKLFGYINKVEEQNDLFKCVTLTDYYNFLRDYPSSVHKKEVLDKIIKLKQDSVYEENKLIIEQKNEENKDTFTLEITDTKNVEVKKKIKPINRIKENKSLKPSVESSKIMYLKNEQKFFNNCVTVTDYMRYLQKYPKGRFVHDAKKAIREIESSKMSEMPQIKITYK